MAILTYDYDNNKLTTVPGGIEIKDNNIKSVTFKMKRAKDKLVYPDVRTFSKFLSSEEVEEIYAKEVEGIYDEVRVRVERLQWNEGDIMLVKIPSAWTYAQIENLQRFLRSIRAKPKPVRFLIVPNDIEFKSMGDKELTRLGLKKI